MKVKMEFDVTPEETRRLLGLPDVSPVNDLLVERLRDQVEKGLDGTLLRNMMHVRTACVGDRLDHVLTHRLVPSKGHGGVCVGHNLVPALHV
jgi:hypothetical protein